MSLLVRLRWILLSFGLVFFLGGLWTLWLALSESKPTVVTWAQFVANEPAKRWFRIEDAPFVDARTVRIIRQKKLGTDEDAYVPVVEDPAVPTGPVRVLLHVSEDLELAPPVVAGATPTVRRAPLEGWRVDLSKETIALLARQAAPLAPNVVCIRAGGKKPMWLIALMIVGGGTAFVLGLKGSRARKRARASSPAPSPSAAPLALREILERSGDASEEDVFEKQLEYDRATIEALEEAGSDLSKPHLIEHHFICPDPWQAAGAVEWGVANGYRPSAVTIKNVNGTEHAYFDLVKSIVPSIELLEPETKAMLDLAERSGIEYDGWGCSVVK